MKSKKANLLQEAIQVLERLEVTEGRIGKESLLEAHSDNLALRAVIRMAIGPDRYYIRPSVNIVCNSSLSDVKSWRAFRRITTQLKHKQVTGNEAYRRVHAFLASCRPQMMKWYCRIINHDLRIGIDRATAEKVWGPEFLSAGSDAGVRWSHNGCAQPKNFEEVFPEGKISYPLGVESRYSGDRANLICFPQDQQVFVFTSTGKRRETIEGIPEFKKQVLEFCRVLNPDTHQPVFLDGQFYTRGNNAKKIVRRKKNFAAQEFLDAVALVLWDWAPLDCYQAGKFSTPWQHRKAQLLLAAGATRPTPHLVRCHKNLWVAGHAIVYSDDQLQRQYEKRIDAGHKGVILKFPRAPHTFACTSDVVKLKPERVCVGVIVDVIRGRGENGPVSSVIRGKAYRLMERYGETKQTKQYFYCRTKKPKELTERLSKLTKERRVSKKGKHIVAFRHGTRLGHLVVKLDSGIVVQVGGGFSQRVKNDQRAMFWRKRRDLIGRRVEFRQQIWKSKSVAANLNRFVKLTRV